MNCVSTLIARSIKFRLICHLGTVQFKRFFRKLHLNSCFRLPKHFSFCTHCSCLFSQLLEIYVFDDADPEPAAYLGLAKVPLITLANDKPIKGTFELRKASSYWVAWTRNGSNCIYQQFQRVIEANGLFRIVFTH